MPRSTFHLTVLCAALLAIGPAAALAQTTNDSTDATMPKAQGTMSSKDTGTLNSSDRKFLEKAASGGMFEVQAGQLAEQKSANDQVKEFGKKMADDHSKVGDELKQIAGNKSAQVPATLDKSEQKEMTKLQKLSGTDFDKEYMKRMVSDHKDDVSAFKKEASSGKDADLKSFASKTLPTLQEHMTLAQTTYDSVKQAGKASSAAAQK